jgi:MoaA/NifB/PqqE/SkfB family radical SAM enzyme
LREKKDFPLDELLPLFDTLKTMGNKQIQLVGGEPLMHRDIGKIIDYLKKRDIYTTMVTNGFFVPARINEIKQLDMVCVSIDGPEEINDSLRGNGAFKRAIKAIETAKANRVPVRTYTLLTKINYRHLDYMMELSRNMNIGMIFELSHVPLHDISELYLSDEETRWTIQNIIKYKKEGYPIFGSLPTFEYAANWPFSYDKIHYDCEPDFDYIKCNMGKLYAHIDTDGRVYPCAAKLAQKMEVLNCREAGFKQAWDFLDSKPCYTCYHLSLNEYNQFFSLNWKVWLNLIKSNLREFGVCSRGKNNESFIDKSQTPNNL